MELETECFCRSSPAVAVGETRPRFGAYHSHKLRQRKTQRNNVYPHSLIITHKLHFETKNRKKELIESSQQFNL